MLVAPAPVSLLIAGLKLGKLNGFPMVFCVVRMIGLIFTVIPFVIVIIFCVVVGANSRFSCLVLLSSQRCWHHCQRDDEGGAQQGRVAETGNRYSHVVSGACGGPVATKAMKYVRRWFMPADCYAFSPSAGPRVASALSAGDQMRSNGH